MLAMRWGMYTWISSRLGRIQHAVALLMQCCVHALIGIGHLNALPMPIPMLICRRYGARATYYVSGLQGPVSRTCNVHAHACIMSSYSPKIKRARAHAHKPRSTHFM